MGILQNITFIGIGAQKSATSWLSRCLSEHPDICVSYKKETNFFLNDIQHPDDYHDYMTCFENCEAEPMRGEFSTLYLSCPLAAKRIYRFCPDMKLIAVLRDPRERAYSHIKHLQSQGKIGTDFDIAKVLTDFPEIITHGLYGRHLDRYLQIFKREQILVLWYDDVVNNPMAVIEKTFRFLEVDVTHVPQGTHKKHNTSAARLSRFHKPIIRIYRAVRKWRIGRMVIHVLKVVGVNAYSLDKFMRFSNFEKSSQTPIHAYTIPDTFQAQFEADAKKMRQLLPGIQLPPWLHYD